MILTNLHKKLLQNFVYGTLESTQVYTLHIKPSFNIKLYSKKALYEIPERKRNYVLSLFKTYGFTDTEISTLVNKRPVILSYHPQKTLKPKLDFFKSIGVSPKVLENILTLDPFVVKRNLGNQIIPSYEYLKSVLHTNESVIAAIKRSTWLLKQDLLKFLAPNIALLRECGVPCNRISMMLKARPRALIQVPDRFMVIIEEVKKMGFNPVLCIFTSAIHVLTGFSRSNWERKCELYRKWGWSDNEILAAFKKVPTCMAVSGEKIEMVMDFLVNKMGWNASDVVKCPCVVLYSLENRIIPRCLVVQFLLSKGLIKKKHLMTVIGMAKKKFLNKFVDPYCAEFPEVLNLYVPKVVSLELDTNLQELDSTQVKL
ncbi:hypothetical protein LguiA_027800 [Lonicera macranthoides]